MASPPDGPSTLVRRLDAFEGLQARANLYRDVLQVHVADLEATLAGLMPRQGRVMLMQLKPDFADADMVGGVPGQ
jgi:hypothetical protein